MGPPQEAWRPWRGTYHFTKWSLQVWIFLESTCGEVARGRDPNLTENRVKPTPDCFDTLVWTCWAGAWFVGLEAARSPQLPAYPSSNWRDQFMAETESQFWWSGLRLCFCSRWLHAGGPGRRRATTMPLDSVLECVPAHIHPPPLGVVIERKRFDSPVCEGLVPRAMRSKKGSETNGTLIVAFWSGFARIELCLRERVVIWCFENGENLFIGTNPPSLLTKKQRTSIKAAIRANFLLLAKRCVFCFRKFCSLFAACIA